MVDISFHIFEAGSRSKKSNPPPQVSETPLYILATAGMRLVEPSRREAVLARLRAGVNSKYEFMFPGDNLEIISGKQGGREQARQSSLVGQINGLTFLKIHLVSFIRDGL